LITINLNIQLSLKIIGAFMVMIVWIYNYLCNHCLSPLKLVRCTGYNIMW